MRSRLALIACGLTAALALVPVACKKGGTAATAATPTAVPTPDVAATAAAAQELFKALKLQTNLGETAAAMIDSEIGRNPGLTPYREVMLAWLKKYMTWEAMQPELTKMYTETFTEAELKQMAVFYGSPAGQKSLEKLPELMQRTAMAGARISQPHQDELRAAMDARSQELKKQAAAGGQGAPPARPPARPQGQGAAPKQPQP